MKPIRLVLLISISFLSFLLKGQVYISVIQSDSCKKWVDSVYQTLSPAQRISQLIMIRALTNQNAKYYDSISSVIIKYQPGGVIYFKGSPNVQVKWNNYWQSISKVPFFAGIDGEWGVAMRLDSTVAFPYQMTLGAIQEDTLIYSISSSIAEQCKRLGIHIDFAPVVDINSNPANPVINFRSFGEDKNMVARKGLLFMKGLQDHKVMASAKHFPGHGNTDSDSHHSLPIINRQYKTIDSIDLYPFKALINQGVASIMVAHLFVPALDTTNNLASSLSSKIVTGLLKDSLYFKGLIFTDALDMKGVTLNNKPGEIELRALLAGSDILLLPQDISQTVNVISKALQDSIIPQSFIENKCKKVLFHKYMYGLNHLRPVDSTNLLTDLNKPAYELINRLSYGSALTLVKNRNNIIPIKCLDTLHLAVVSIGDTVLNTFQKIINQYAPVDFYNLSNRSSKENIDSLLRKLKQYNLIIVSLHCNTQLAQYGFGITQKALESLKAISDQNKIVLCLFGNAYGLDRIYNSKNVLAICLAYQNLTLTQELSAQALFGGQVFKGVLPVTASSAFPLGTSTVTKSLGRLSYTIPEALDISSSKFFKIDSIAKLGIQEKAYPGCQILLAKDGKVIYYKSFGYSTYNNSSLVNNYSIYDVASLTKIMATTLAVMKLYDEKKIDINQRLSHYLPYLKESNKRKITIKEVMTHQARLRPWIYFAQKTLCNGQPDTLIYHKVYSSDFSIKIIDSLYLRNDYKQVIQNEIIQSPLLKKKEYRYSDLGFYLLKDLVEQVSGEPFEQYLKKNFYNPLGLSTLGFNPLERFSKDRIIPSEVDAVFRKQIVWGYVNDPGAAMLGGISGHAGLFSDANDLAIIMQMLLQNGEYGGKRYLDSNTVKLFTSCQFNDNRRGLGFDKPLLAYRENSHTCESASSMSFGHTGFTGTYAWADPQTQMIFIFLSNRTYPSSSNDKLSKMNIRTDIHQVFYDAIEMKK